jgi:hypothetical protein
VVRREDVADLHEEVVAEEGKACARVDTSSIRSSQV